MNSSMALTLPETLAWTTEASPPSVRPMTVPTNTSCPGLTAGSQGLPTCCARWMWTVLGTGIASVAHPLVFLKCPGKTPPLVFLNAFLPNENTDCTLPY